MIEYENIIVEFQGWLSIHPNRIMFQYIGEDDSKQPLINGCKYVKLSKEEREEYVIDCLVAVMRDSDDLEFEYLDIEVEQ